MQIAHVSSEHQGLNKFFFPASALYSPIAVGAQQYVAVAPIAADFDEELQEDRLAQERLDVFARRRAHLLQRPSSLADQNALLGLALDDDLGLDEVFAVGAFLVVGDVDGGRVGDLLLVLLEDFLADDLGYEEPLGVLADHVFRVERRPRRQALFDLGHQHIDVEAVERREGDDRFEGAQPGVLFYQRQGFFLLDQVDFVDGQDSGAAADLLQAERVGVVLPGVGHEDEQIGVGDSAVDAVHHRLLELVARYDDAGRVEEDDLRRLFGEDTEDAVARRLCLGRDDGKLTAQQCVHQRALAHIRLPHERYVRAAVVGGDGVLVYDGFGHVFSFCCLLTCHGSLVITLAGARCHWLTSFASWVITLAGARCHWSLERNQ